MPSIARARAASPQPPKLNLHLFSPAARPPSSLTDRIAYRPETKSGSHTLSAGGRWIRTIGTPPNFFGRPSTPARDLRHIRSGRRCLRQHRNLLLDTEPAPPFHAPQYLGNRVRHRSCVIASSSSKPASRILTPPTARQASFTKQAATGA